MASPIRSPAKSPNRRRETDVMRLMMSHHEVSLDGDSMRAFVVKFRGPADSLYAGGLWRVRVELPENYPYRSPSIGFLDRIFHPNVDEASGSVCLDVINQTWSPMFDLTNIFESFLPQLLMYPNPADPLNGEAAAMSINNSDEYARKVKSYVQTYARDPDFVTAHPPREGSDTTDPHNLHRAFDEADDDDDDDVDDDDDGFFPDMDM